jgi:hypothetical protein
MTGHPAQFAVTACWVVSGFAGLRGRPALAGSALAVASAWEPWGLLGAPLLVLLPDTGARVRGALWLAAGTALLWAPFVLLGDFAMHHFRWAVRPHSLLAPVLGVFSPFGWPLRLLQGGLALAAGLLMASVTPQRAHRVWSVPLVVVVVRLVVDPVGAEYYWVPVKVLALVGAAVFLAERDRRGWLVLPFLYPAFLVTLVPQWFMAGSVLTGMGMLAAAGRGVAAQQGPAAGVTRPGGSGREPSGRSSLRSRVPSV